MVTEFSCICGNTSPADTIEYDGALGYEAIICTKCGRIHDVAGVHPADDFSRDLIAKNNNKTA